MRTTALHEEHFQASTKLALLLKTVISLYATYTFNPKSFYPQPRTADVPSKAIILISLLAPVLLCLSIPQATSQIH